MLLSNGVVSRCTTAPPERSMRSVALLIDTSGSYGRGILGGVAKYNRQHQNWSTCFRSHDARDGSPPLLSNWRGDGMLVQSVTSEIANFASRTGITMVQMSEASRHPRFPTVAVDQAASSRLAEQHLIERGVGHFAFREGRARTASSTGQ